MREAQAAPQRQVLTQFVFEIAVEREALLGLVELVLELAGVDPAVDAVLRIDHQIAVVIIVVGDLEVARIEHLLTVVIGADDEIERAAGVAGQAQVLRELLGLVVIGNFEQLDRLAIGILDEVQRSLVV